MTPLITVVLPCYNSAATLHWAIASLIAQTYQEWECIFVDDGSSDRPDTILRPFFDERVRFFRWPKNRGRGAARRFGVEQARGKYITFLDADDWLFPSKLDTQVRIMESEERLPMVSAGMAILGREGDLAGVRTPRGSSSAFNTDPPLSGLRLPPFAFAPTMFREHIVKRYQFDGSFRVAEDCEFLMRVLTEHSYVALPVVLYAYSEDANPTYSKTLAAGAFACKIFLKHWTGHPFGAALSCMKMAGKALIQTGAFAVGQGARLVRRRSRPPTAEEMANFEKARATVAAVARRFGGSEKGSPADFMAGRPARFA